MKIVICFATAYHILHSSCGTIDRVEVDDDATGDVDGLHVDPYGNECGEQFLLDNEGGDSNFARDSPPSNHFPHNLSTPHRHRTSHAALGYRCPEAVWIAF